jgi:cobalt-precorrin 5A hydrolase
MAMGEAMIVAGIGCRRGTPAAAIEAVITAALERAGLAKDALTVVAVPANKCDEPGIAMAVSGLGLPLVVVAQAELERAGRRAITRSERVLKLLGVPSAAEAAALAAAGQSAWLLAPRVAIGPATCALAATEAA